MFCLFPDLAGNMAGGVKEEIINNWWLHYTARYDLVRDKTRNNLIILLLKIYELKL